MSTHHPPVSASGHPPVSGPASAPGHPPVSGPARSSVAGASPQPRPEPPSAPPRPRSAPPPGARTTVAAVLLALAGAVLLNAPSPAVARAEREAAAPAGTTAVPSPVVPVPSPVVPVPSPVVPVPSPVVPVPPLTVPVPPLVPAGSVQFPSLASVSPASLSLASVVPAPVAASGASASDGPVHFAGKAFDTCEAPSLAVMQAWRSSPYGAVGIYFGGRGRGCPVQKELTPAWVASAHAMGWRLLPLFVGSQAPCVDSSAKRKFAIGSTPWSQGTQEGGDAVEAARALGIGTSSPLYLDIEAYRQGDADCAATTLSFVRAWNREVRRLGYLPGFYSSAETGVRDIEAQRRAGTADLPDVMWFARWRGQPALLTEPVLQPQAWTPNARIHQYAGNVTESYGGRTMVIDRNAMDAPVARVSTTSRLAPHVPVPLRFVEGHRP
ncbi:DUF1906 domain-containing protein [Streptomyces sp. NPDC058872]|uniref:DUF1906 domain-containing protein n=1 Tax=Streptomyces sp. NPDC058872 TaxID=3346661 RepID=UPI0036C66E7F